MRKSSKNIIRRETVSKLKIAAIAFILSILLSGCADKVGGEAAEYRFNFGGVEIAVGEDADKTVAALGEPIKRRSASSCAGVGVDEMYVYAGFRLIALRTDKGAEISTVELTSDAVATPEGVRIGESEERLIEIYGEGKDLGGGVEYSCGNTTLRFTTLNGRITGIKYLKNSS